MAQSGVIPDPGCMATRTLLFDDLDESPDPTIRDRGRSYEVDLPESNREAFEKALAPYVAAARAAGGRSRRAGPANAEVRACAATSGFQVAAQGRVPASVVHAYVDAHGAGSARKARTRTEGSRDPAPRPPQLELSASRLSVPGHKRGWSLSA